MFRVLLKLALGAAAVWAVWSFVPVAGRTLSDRWRAAGSVPAFLERGWAEITGPARPPPRAQARQRPAPDRPAEAHTEADRRAVDRILADHLDGRR